MTQQKQEYDRTSYILIVDDDNTLLKFFKIHLNKFFSKVIVVKNAAEATATLKEKKIDLVITDIVMPKTSGFQLMKKVRKQDTTIPVLIISGAVMNEAMEEELKSADGFLSKPFTMDQLHRFIDEGMKKREHYLQLADLIKNPADLLKLIEEKVEIDKVAIDGKKDRIEQILQDLKKNVLNETA